jgi:hypothetical protein
LENRDTNPDIYKFYTKNIEIVQNFIGLYQVKLVSFREKFVLSLNIDFLCTQFLGTDENPIVKASKN